MATDVTEQEVTQYWRLMFRIIPQASINEIKVIMKASIQWKKYEEGGRRIPPTGVGEPLYATVVFFKDSPDAWPPPLVWSFVIEKIEVLSTDYEWIANVRYLFDHAPANELHPGRQFELYEGRKCVATGVLIAGDARGV